MSKVIPFASGTTEASFEALVRLVQHPPGSAIAPTSPDDRPMYGQTLYLAACTLDMRMGTFRAHIFQDLIDKHYIIALAHGDICGADMLYTRLHSSCVTSETLLGCDCDCVQQLEGALDEIARRGRGILFYSMQEGRGVGYVGKARDRMLVQASQDRMSTFAAYESMGLRKDHRNYDNIAQICYLLNIRASFTVLTNNPDKVEAMRRQGMRIAGTQALEYEPSPFNLAYLASKATGGHALKRPSATQVKRASPPSRVEPFKPHALAAARRFIYSASYFLPIKPVENEVILSEAQFRELFHQQSIERYMAGPTPGILGHRKIRENRYAIHISPDGLRAHLDANPDDPVVALLTTPYWFQVHVYYDLVSSQDFVVLTYGTPRAQDVPVVRVHSESLFNRFPLRAATNREKMMGSVRHIVEYGSGALILLYNDGRGAGFGAYATESMMTERGQVSASEEAYRMLGVEYDSRDYEAAMFLLRHHIPSNRIQMIMNSPASLVRKTEYTEALHAHRIEVDRWIFLEDPPVTS